MTDLFSDPPRPSDYCDFFEYTPISLWDEDYSGIKRTFDQLKAQGVHDLAAHLDHHPEVVATCMQQVIVRSVDPPRRWQCSRQALRRNWSPNFTRYSGRI